MGGAERDPHGGVAIDICAATTIRASYLPRFRTLRRGFVWRGLRLPDTSQRRSDRFQPSSLEDLTPILASRRTQTIAASTQRLELGSEFGCVAVAGSIGIQGQEDASKGAMASEPRLSLRSSQR